MEEEWKKLKGLSRYSINQLGEVRTDKSGRVLKYTVSNSGYPSILLTNDSGKRKSFTVHRLVCAAFHGDAPRDKPVVNHLDGNKINNVAVNLEWCSRSENSFHSLRNGKRLGAGSGVAVLSVEKVKFIRDERARGISYNKISESLQVSKSTVWMAGTGLTWKHVPSHKGETPQCQAPQ